MQIADFTLSGWLPLATFNRPFRTLVTQPATFFLPEATKLHHIFQQDAVIGHLESGGPDGQWTRTNNSHMAWAAWECC